MRQYSALSKEERQAFVSEFIATCQVDSIDSMHIHLMQFLRKSHIKLDEPDDLNELMECVEKKLQLTES
ncbi:MAG: hypothetical protein SCK57_11550 [Bacillota bacterium]|nr:hypothetical protein [Bacillota bacterium]MDW7678285.1 hypothetical protein [Bacillota bacterium]